MNIGKTVWNMNIPKLFDLLDFGLDDAGADQVGNIYVSDSVNSCIYKFGPNAVFIDKYPISFPTASDSLLNLSVANDSKFYIPDSANGYVFRHTSTGTVDFEYWTPGVITMCCGADGSIFVLSSTGGIDRIERYDAEGSMIDVLPCPIHSSQHPDTSLIKLAADPEGNVYVIDGISPYRIWKLRAFGGGTDLFGREMDYPEDTLLIADIATDPVSGVLLLLLACKHSGLQMLDFFSRDGKFLGTMGLPHSEVMYTVMCPGSGSDLYLLDTGTGAGAGDLVRISRT